MKKFSFELQSKDLINMSMPLFTYVPVSWEESLSQSDLDCILYV